LTAGRPIPPNRRSAGDGIGVDTAGHATGVSRDVSHIPVFDWRPGRPPNMNVPRTGLLGLQVTLVGVLLGTLWADVPPYDVVAFVLGVVGTILVSVAVVTSA
jgi:hypothetical protein